MGYKVNWDKNQIWLDLSRMMAEVRSSYNDGYVSREIKRELYDLKCFLDDGYAQLPKFADEKQWEKERVLRILKQP